MTKHALDVLLNPNVQLVNTCVLLMYVGNIWIFPHSFPASCILILGITRTFLTLIMYYESEYQRRTLPES